MASSLVFKRFKPCDPALPSSHPGIDLITNHFRLLVPRCSVFHYDVDIRGKFERRDRHSEMADRKFRKMWHQINFHILEKLVEQNSSEDQLFNWNGRPVVPAFDGTRNFYTCHPLNVHGTDKSRRIDRDVVIQMSSKPVQFLVTIKLAAVLNLERINDFFERRTSEVPNDLIRALDIILRYRPVASGLPVGQTIYPRIQNSYDELVVRDRTALEQVVVIGSGKRALFGHYQSVRLMSRQLNVIVDRTAAVVYDCQPIESFISITYGGERVQQQLEDDRRRQVLPFELGHGFLTDRANLVAMIDFTNPVNHRIVQRNIELLNRELKGVQIETCHLGYKRRYKIHELTSRSVSEVYFKKDEPQSSGAHHRAPSRPSNRLSVYTYFQEKYGTRMAPNLPCLDVGSRSRHVFLPLEVCCIAPNQMAKRLNQEETTQLIKLASNQPVEKRFELIQQNICTIQRQSQSILDEFNIDLSTEPVRVNGVRLPSPQITYAGQISYQPYFGNWGMNDKRVFEDSPLPRQTWAIANFSGLIIPQVLEGLADKLMRTGAEMGINIGEPVYLNETFNGGNPFVHDGRESIRRLLQQTVDHFEQNNFGPIQIVLFVIPKTRGDTIYKDIKRESEITFGLITQCLTDRNAQNINSREGRMPRNDGEKILANLLLKMNVKLGGTNCVISEDELSQLGDFDLPGLMVIGSDVTHPAPSDQFAHSICSVVGNCDSNFCKYLSVVRVQSQSKEEMIKEMRSIMLELLEMRLTKLLGERLHVASPEDVLRSLPKKIIYYRDGVSEGQYNQLLEFEHKNMRDAFRDLDEKYSLEKRFDPPVTIIVVLKRHNTRFKSLTDESPDPGLLYAADDSPNDPAHEPAPSFNVPPGTLVDHPNVVQTDHEFFLCSHLSSQGTIRSTHYYVLLNECSYRMDQLHRFSYYLCFLFAKCTKSLSIPAPVKYAHLAAYRARQHLAGVEEAEQRPVGRERRRQPPPPPPPAPVPMVPSLRHDQIPPVHPIRPPLPHQLFPAFQRGLPPPMMLPFHHLPALGPPLAVPPFQPSSFLLQPPQRLIGAVIPFPPDLNRPPPRIFFQSGPTSPPALPPALPPAPRVQPSLQQQRPRPTPPPSSLAQESRLQDSIRVRENLRLSFYFI